MPKFFASTIDTDDYVRADPDNGQDVLEGDTNWRVATLRKTDAPGAFIWAGMVTGDPSVARLAFDSNETVVVLEGEADVEIDGEEVVELRPGVVASFLKGTVSVWKIKTPIKQFFVISD